jgi:hypothetical protein
MKNIKSLIAVIMLATSSLCFTSHNFPVFYRFRLFRYVDWKNKQGLIEVVQTSYIKCDDTADQKLKIKKLIKELPLNVGDIIEERVTFDQNPLAYQRALDEFQYEQNKLAEFEKKLREHKANPWFKKKPNYLLEWNKSISSPLLDYVMVENNDGKVYIETDMHLQNAAQTTLSIEQPHRTSRTPSNQVKIVKIYFKQDPNST